MDLSILKELLPIMRDCKVKTLEFDGLKLTFQDLPGTFPTTTTINYPAQPDTLRPSFVWTAQTPSSETQTSGSASSFIPPAIPLVTNDPIKTDKIQDSVVPQGLEEEMSFDKILHWSGSEDTGSVPLTDDVALDSNTNLELPKEANA